MARGAVWSDTAGVLPHGFHPEELPKQVARPGLLLAATLGLGAALTGAAWLTAESSTFVSDLLLHLAGGAFVAVLLQALLPALTGAADSVLGQLVNIELDWSTKALETVVEGYDDQERVQLFASVGTGRYPARERTTTAADGSVITYRVTRRGWLLRKRVLITAVEKHSARRGTGPTGPPHS